MPVAVKVQSGGVALPLPNYSLVLLNGPCDQSLHWRAAACVRQKPEPGPRARREVESRWNG